MTGAMDFSAADDTTLRSHTTAFAKLQAPTAVTGTTAPAGRDPGSSEVGQAALKTQNRAIHP